MTSNETVKSNNPEADLVVIGGGGAGLAAAVAAAEEGAKNIIVLEARNVPGGNSVLASGFFTPGDPAQKRAEITASNDDYFQKAMSYAHWKTNPRLFRA